ncbi:MAG TPA: hypothetical protein VE987_01970, partial [Polyangiaceae bacterium]|nr:hypothetical protein [Polyangiaceae bacterium]
DDSGAITEPDSASGEDGSTTGGDAGSGSDSGATSETGADAGPQPDSGAPDGADGGTCPTLIDTGNATCDLCIESACCTQWDTCASADDAGVDDAGASACVRLTQCVLDWVAADAGDVANGESTCDPAYTSAEQTASHNVLSCISGSCATACQ